jgi:hypothetical protein
METLLRNDFTAYYGLPTAIVSNISINTAALYFEIEDDEHKETQIHLIRGMGMAAYKNVNGYEVTILNYDKFLTSLPHIFHQRKQRCDLILHTKNKRYFLLNELKDKKPKNKVRTESINQLLASLKLIMTVPAIAAFANAHRFRHCCFFNKQSMAGTSVTAEAANRTAVNAFNRLSRLTPNGLKMSNPEIEALGFEFWEYSGNQIYNL